MKSDSQLTLEADQIFAAHVPLELGFYSSSTRERWRKKYIQNYIEGYRFAESCFLNSLHNKATELN